MVPLQIKVRTDARKLERRPEEILAHAFPIGTVELGNTRAIGIQDCSVCLSLVHELRGEDFTGVDALIVKV